MGGFFGQPWSWPVNVASVVAEPVCGSTSAGCSSPAGGSGRQSVFQAQVCVIGEEVTDCSGQRACTSA